MPDSLSSLLFRVSAYSHHGILPIEGRMRYLHYEDGHWYIYYWVYRRRTYNLKHPYLSPSFFRL